jgi:hypothetical protein
MVRQLWWRTYLGHSVQGHASAKSFFIEQSVTLAGTEM